MLCLFQHVVVVVMITTEFSLSRHFYIKFQALFKIGFRLTAHLNAGVLTWFRSTSNFALIIIYIVFYIVELIDIVL